MKINITYLLFTILFVVLGCEQINVEPSLTEELYFKYSEINENLDCYPILNSLSNSKPTKDFSRLTQFSIQNADSIVESLLNDGQDKPSYSLRLNPDDPFSWDYLIIDRHHEGYLAYIIQFIPDLSVDVSMESMPSIEMFTGEFKVFDLEGNLESTSYYAQGEFVDQKSNTPNNGKTNSYVDCDCHYIYDYDFKTKYGELSYIPRIVGIECTCKEPALVQGEGDGAGGETIGDIPGSFTGDSDGGDVFGPGTYYPDGSGGSENGITGDSNTSEPAGTTDNSNYTSEYLAIEGSDVRLSLELIIAQEPDPVKKASTQLLYINDFGGQEGKDFANFAKIALTDVSRDDYLAFLPVIEKAYLDLKGRMIMAIINPETIGTILSFGINNTQLNSVARAKYFTKVARYANEITGKGYKSFDAFKQAHGAAGDNFHWHHVVEQRLANLNKFGSSKIHNTKNLFKVQADKHTKITGYYNSKPLWTKGVRVREFLDNLTYEEQYEFGLDIMHRVLNNLPLP